jgi:hypothetical protein
LSYLRSCRKILLPTFPTVANNRLKIIAIASTAWLFVMPCLAQQPPAAGQSESQNITTQVEAKSTITIAAGTRISLVLTQPVQSRYVRRGDDVFAQVVSPVDSGNQVVIPAGTFVQGSIEKLERRSTQGELRLQSLSVTFPDGYVTPIAGPITLHSDDGYALKDPGSNRMVGAFAIPAAGAGVGALIGHSVGSSQSTMTTTLPPGCTGPPPYCLSSSMTVPGSAGRDTAIGAGVGAAAGMIASVALLFGSHHFYVVAGAPIQMTLQQSVTLPEDEVAKAVRDSAQHPVQVQPIAPLPVYYPPYPYPDMGNPMPLTPPPMPPTIIPGAPGPDGVPGPPIVIPGTPGS